MNCGLLSSKPVSNPAPLDLRASYVVVDASPSGYTVRHMRVEYAYEEVISAVKRSRHPSGEYIISHFRGHRPPWWSAE